MEVHTISDELARKYLSQDLAKERDSDEDGGIKTRVEFDSDFSYEEEEENEIVEEMPDEDVKKKEDWSKLLTKNRRKHNTGAKGVKADYEEAKQIIRRRNETKRLQEREAFQRAAYGATTQADSVSFHSLQANGSLVKTYDGDNEQDSDGSDLDDDDAFLQQYRQLRVSQFDAVRRLPQFGRVLYVDKFKFLDETDNTGPDTFVVVHVYEEYINACKRLNKIMDELAAKYPHVKFLKMLCTEASQTLSHRALPAFLVYRQTEMVGEAMENIPSYIGSDEFTISDIEYLLVGKYGIVLPGVDVTSEDQAISQFREAEKSSNDAWRPKAGSQILGRVSLKANRVNKAESDSDDDW